MFSGINSNVQEQIPSAFRSGGFEKYENDCGLNLLSAKIRKTSENVRKTYKLLCKKLSAVPERTIDEFELILGKTFMGYASVNFTCNAEDENDEVNRVMMEVEPLLEASGKRNWRTIMSTHVEFPCPCLLQTWWYPERSNLELIWDCGELLSDSSQPITIVIVGFMMAIRWLEAHVKDNIKQEPPRKKQLHNYRNRSV